MSSSKRSRFSSPPRAAASAFTPNPYSQKKKPKQKLGLLQFMDTVPPADASSACSTDVSEGEEQDVGSAESDWQSLDDQFDELRQALEIKYQKRGDIRNAATAFVCGGCSTACDSHSGLRAHQILCIYSSFRSISYDVLPTDHWICIGSDIHHYTVAGRKRFSVGCGSRYCFSYFVGAAGAKYHAEVGQLRLHENLTHPYIPAPSLIQGVHDCRGLCSDVNCRYVVRDWSVASDAKTPLRKAIDRVKFHVYNTHRHLLDIATKANIVMTASAGSSTYLSLHTDACTVRTTCMTDFALQRIIWRKWRSDLNVAMIVETLSTMTPDSIGSDIAIEPKRVSSSPCSHCATTLTVRYRKEVKLCEVCYVRKNNGTLMKLVLNPKLSKDGTRVVCLTCRAKRSTSWNDHICRCCRLADVDRVPKIVYGGPCHYCLGTYSSGYWRIKNTCCTKCNSSKFRLAKQETMMKHQEEEDGATGDEDKEKKLEELGASATKPSSSCRARNSKLSVRQGDIQGVQAYISAEAQLVPAKRFVTRRNPFIGHDHLPPIPVPDFRYRFNSPFITHFFPQSGQIQVQSSEYEAEKSNG